MTKEQFIEKMKRVEARFPNVNAYKVILDELADLKTEAEWNQWWTCYSNGTFGSR